jgi:hypothetical protein
MKIYLNLDELKLIQSTLYKSFGSIKTEIENEKIKDSVRENCNEKLAEHEKLIAYLGQIIRNEED